ncbi:MAG: hypothetical protein QOH81_1107 [Sphingomonadales bacterium]|jgi:hypothetical protein|nr:hypothetical protein [Sphingomonadales bacterium]
MTDQVGLSPERIKRLELPINRTSYHLRRGVPESDITPELIGLDVLPAEIPSIIAISRARTAAAEVAYRAMTRKSALGYMAFGVAMLSLFWFATSGGASIPSGRFGGRAIAVILVGGGSLLYGIWRWIDPRYRD